MPKRTLQAFASTLVLSGLMLATAACQDLTSDSSDTTSSVTTSSDTTTSVREGIDTGTAVPSPSGTGSEGEGPVPWGSEATEPPDSGDDGLLGFAVPFGTETTERWPGWPGGLTLDNGNDGQTWPIVVGNTLTVELRFLIGDGIAEVNWAATLPPVFRETDWEETRGRFGRFCTEVRAEFEITAPGDGSLLISMYNEDGSFHSDWRVRLEVSE